MRFKIEQKKPLKEGDVRVIETFLSLPLKLKGEIRWLEKTLILQVATRQVDMTSGYNKVVWSSNCFFNCYDCIDCNSSSKKCEIKNRANASKKLYDR